MTTTHARFDALGTYAFLAVRRPGGLADTVRLAKRVLADIDATCSRFREDSDLTRANRNAGKWVEVDPLLIAAVEAACDAAKQSGGLVHPLLGRPMVQLGYDRDFDQLSERADTLQFPWTDPGPSLDSWQEIGLDHTGAIRVPDGTALDLGSVGKAWASDMIAAGIEQQLGVPAIVSLGGDIRIACPDWDPWHVAISERPGASADALVGLVCRRSGDLEHPGPPLEARRSCPSPPAGPPHRRTGLRGLAHGDRDRVELHRRQHRQHGVDRPRARGDGLARRPGRHRPTRRRPRKRHPHRQLAGRGPRKERSMISSLMESLGLEGPVLWYLNRSTGVVSIVLLTVTTVLGVLAIGGRPAGRVPRFVTQAFHRNVALLSVLLLVVHLVTAVLDEFVEIRWYEVFIPFVGSYEPLWVGFGAIATDLMIVVVVTSLFRTRMNHNLWRGLHVTTYGLWALAIGHGIGVGTDMTESMWLLTVVCAIAVPLAAALRLGRLVIDRTSTSSTTPGGLK